MCWHKWDYLEEPIDDKFLGVEYTRYWNRFRVCIKCNKCQEYDFDSMGGSWRTLNECEVKILKSKYEIYFSVKGKD